MVEQPSTNSVLNLCDSIAELLGHCLTFKGFDGVGMSGGGHDNEGDDCHIGSCFLQAVI